MGHAYFDCNDTTLSFSLLDGNPTITLRRVYERGDSLQAAEAGMGVEGSLWVRNEVAGEDGPGPMAGELPVRRAMGY